MLLKFTNSSERSTTFNNGKGKAAKGEQSDAFNAAIGVIQT
jgi:hypothetical protein